MPSEWPLLARGNLFFGDIRRVAAPAEYFGWASTPAPAGADGFLLPSVQTVLGALPETVSPEALDGPSRLTVLIRDALPPWEDTVLGLTPGGIGETSAIALLAAAAYLVYRGIVEARVPAVAVLAALVTAALMPLTLPGEAGLAVPMRLFDKGDPVGWLYVLFELTASEIIFVSAFFVTDWPTTPVTRRGRVVFAALVGVLTIILARIGLVPGASYWAVLSINALTPLIDRLFAQRVLGSRSTPRVDAAGARRYISTL
jgi:electron transport complex protein RnfD